MADKKNMSVADILAAARKADGGSSDDAPPAAEAPAEAAAPEAASAEPAAAAPVPKLKPGERPSVKDMLAMARAGDKAGAAKPAAAPAAAKAKPKAEAKAAPAKKKPEGPKVAAARRDTASILAAARKGDKPGPITKAEAAKQQGGKPKAPPKPKKPAPPMPEKPAYAKAVVDEGRRAATKAGLFATIGSALFGSSLRTGFTALASTAGLASLSVARYMFPNILTEPPSRFKVGFPDAFSAGVVETKFKAQFGIWVVKGEYQGEAQLFALSTVCTHLGCTPNWLEAEQKFKCPCHGSGFYKDGINFEGPAPRPLERYAIRIADDGQVEIDKSKKFQEEMGQWEDPNSFVSV